MQDTVILVGCGNMGFAMLKGWLDSGILQSENVHVVEPSEALQSRAALAGVNACSSADSSPMISIRAWCWLPSSRKSWAMYCLPISALHRMLPLSAWLLAFRFHSSNSTGQRCKNHALYAKHACRNRQGNACHL